MYEIIRGNLNRQAKGLELLRQLLDEEFSLLLERDTDLVMSLEFSIHELIRQLANEKRSVRQALGGGKILDYAAMLDEDKSKTILALWHAIDKEEQHCSRQASLNAELSLALLNQSRSLLSYLHTNIQPKSPKLYGRAGGVLSNRPDAVILSGRL